MNAVGIDVSKGKSMIEVMRPFGEVVSSPFEVRHTDSELSELAKLLKSLNGETCVVMEATGNYHAPMARSLHDAGIYVTVVNAMLVHDYGNNSLRRAKTDKKDAIKLANYAIDRWLTLSQYFPEEDTRLLLKNCYRQYQHDVKLKTMLKNNLISLLDQCFPEVNRLFSSPPRADGSWASSELSGTVRAYAGFQRRRSHCATRSGAEKMATISVRKKLWISTPPPAVMSAFCRKPTLRSCWWSMPFLN